VGADWIRIRRLPTGQHSLSGCFGPNREIVLSDGRFQSYGEAKLAGVYLANDRGAKILYVEEVEMDEGPRTEQGEAA
jgi:hypothetical protein